MSPTAVIRFQTPLPDTMLPMTLSNILGSTVRMGQLLVQRREPAWVTRDSSTGGWIHRWHGGTFVSPRARGIAWRAAEAGTRELFCHEYQPVGGDVVVELGAGYGTETVTLSRMVGPSGRVIAVEAHPWTCELLRATIKANALENVEVVNAAAVGRDGPVTLSDRRDDTLINSLAAEGVTVEGVTLDTLVTRFELTQINLLKINIEGAERVAVEGMEAAIHLVRHAVISCHDFRADAGDGEWFRTSRDIDAALARWDFTSFTRDEDPRPWVSGYRYASR